jgi:hypothetical protein
MKSENSSSCHEVLFLEERGELSLSPDSPVGSTYLNQEFVFLGPTFISEKLLSSLRCIASQLSYAFHKKSKAIPVTGRGGL